MTNRLLLICLALGLFPAQGSSWFATGPFGGDAEVVRTVPKVRGMAIAGAHNGLLFVTTNGGALWRNLAFPGQFAGVLHALEVDPRSPSTFYVGMESESEWIAGVYKTTDAGATWSLLPGTRGLAVWSIALWPENADTIAVGTGKGVYLSRDAGGSWKHISPPDDPEIRPVVSLAFHPSNAEILYAGTTHLPWRTIDGGKNWSSIHQGMMDDSDVFSIQVDFHQPERVFASACSGVYRSQDAAEKWAHLDTPQGAFRTHFVSLDPNHRDVVFAGTTGGLLRSSDSGHTWKRVSTESIKSIAFDPFVPERIFFASTTSGLLLSSDGGATLRECNVGFTNRNFTAVATSGMSLYANSVFEGVSGGVYRSDTLGLRWVREGAPGEESILSLSVSPENPQIVWATTYHGLVASDDGGRTWKPRKGPPADRIAAVLTLSDKNVLAATSMGIFRTIDGTNWIQSLTGGVVSLHGNSATPSLHHMISALTAKGATASADDGATWTPCGPVTRSASAREIAWYAVDFDSGSPQTALAATSAGLFRSADGCRSWIPATTGLKPETTSIVVFHPTRAGEAYASQSGRVFRSTDGGQRWLPLDDDAQGNSGPTSLVVLPASPDKLFALFPRRGVHSISIKENQFQ